MPKPFLFVGDRRSKKAVLMGVTWRHGRLSAKQLFFALRSIGIDPGKCGFVNLFEGNGRDVVKRHLTSHVIVGMGKKVQAELTRMGISYRAMIHPAARGSIRKIERYVAHVRDVLTYHNEDDRRSVQTGQGMEMANETRLKYCG